MPLKIVHIIPTLDQGGAEKQLCLLATHLDRSRFDTHVIALTRSGPREQELRNQGIPVYQIGKRGKCDPIALWRLKTKLRELRPDIVHTWLFAANSYGRIAARAAGVPVIIAGERCVDPWKSSWQLSLDRWLLRSTRAVITNTSAVVDFYAYRRLPVDRFFIIPNAVEQPVFPRMTREEVYAKLGIPARDRLIMAIGRLWPQKGYPEMIWSADLLQVAFKKVWMVVIGDGPQRERLQHYRDQTRAEEAVRFVGERTDAQQLLSGADVLWNSSLYEGQSNTILEAMSLGIPVVATDIPGTRDLVDPGKTGFLYKPGDCAALARQTMRLLSEPELHATLSRNAAQRANEEFSIALMVQRHADLYERLKSLK